MYAIRFWNAAGECIRVGGKFHHEFDSWIDAWDAANALMASAYKRRAVEMDINNKFYAIIDDPEVMRANKKGDNMKTTVTKTWKVTGLPGHRMSQSFGNTVTYDFSSKEKTRVITIVREDITGTNDFVYVIICRDTPDECEEELLGQINDGFFENCHWGSCEEVK